MRGVVLGAGWLAGDPVEPIVGGAQPDQEEQRHGDQGDDRDRAPVDHGVLMLERADEYDQPEGESEA